MTEGKEIISTRGAVAAGPAEAARIGARILKADGNAMDAASAACMACCMLQPHSTGIGGYVCSAVVLEGKSNRVWSVDANSIAPAAAHEGMFEVLPPREGGGSLNEREYSCCVRDDANVYGPLAVGPPGMMAGMGIIWERWGKLKWHEIVAPSLKLLADGFPYGSTAAAIGALQGTIRKYSPTTKHLMPEGKVPSREDIWHRRDMEKTLERIAKAGWRDFYDGQIGGKIADYIQQTGGILTRDDMAQYEPRITEPYEITYRNASVYGPILTNGCLTSLQILNMLDCFDALSDDTPEYWHCLAEILKLAWRDRIRYLGDPDFIHVPVELLLSKDYAAGRTETIRQFPKHVDKLDPVTWAETHHGTMHVSAADSEGNMVSITISHGAAFGSCITVPETGIILGHGMCRLDPRPGKSNSVASRKRPLNNTACMIARLPDQDIAIGLPGGRKIVSVMPRAVQLIVDNRATGHQAAISARMHVEMSEPVEITQTAGDSVIDALRGMGHEIKAQRAIAGDMNCAEILKDTNSVRAGGNAWAAG